MCGLRRARGDDDLRGAGRSPAPAVAGRYLLQRRLGRGGAKDVWLAHDLTLDRGVALARAPDGASAWERLRREARLTARLGGHRHIVTVHDVFRGRRRAVPRRPLHDRRLARRPARPRPAGGWRRRRRSAPAARSPTRSPTPTRTGSCTATSSPTTSGSTPRARPALGDFGVAVAEGESAPPAAARHAVRRRPSRRWRAATPLSRPLRARRDALRAAVRRRPFDSEDPLFRTRAPASRRRSRAPGVPEALDRLILALLARDPPTGRRTRPRSRDALDRLIGAPSRRSWPSPRPRAARRPRRRARRLRARTRGRARAARAGRARGRARHRQDDAPRRAGRRGRHPRRRRGARPRRRGGARVRRLAGGAAPARGGRAAASAVGVLADPPAHRRRPPAGRRRPLGAAAPGGEEQRLRLYDAVADARRGRRGRSRAVDRLDDLHWADAPRCGCWRTSCAPSRPPRLLVRRLPRARSAPRSR